MRPIHLLAGLLAAAGLLGLAAAQGQPATDMSRVLQWFDTGLGLPRYASSQYPLPMRSAPASHNTMATVPLANAVAQVVIPAGMITSGCDITFSNSYGSFYLAYTDPGAPTVPTAAAGRGLQLQFGGGFVAVQGFVYRCPVPTAQGLSIMFVENSGNAASTPAAYIGVDVY